MAEKLRLTKNEQKKQKDALKRFDQYLPTLRLKKQQLQVERAKIDSSIEKLKTEKAYNKAETYKWVDVFAENAGLEKLIGLEQIVTTDGNIAGVDIPVFERAVFREEDYDFESTPLWVDYGIEMLKKIMTINARIVTAERQHELVSEELRITTQRVNLFEKVMIPQTRENIRRITIYLGDLEIAAVVTGKIAKAKIERNAMMEIMA